MRNNKNNITFSVKNITLNKEILILYLENIILKLEILISYLTEKQKIIILSFKNIILTPIIIILSFTNITLCSSNIFNNSNVSALDYSSNVGVGFTFNPSLSISISSADLVISNLVPGDMADSDSIDINVSTNNTYGYSLYASAGNEDHNNTSLTHINEDSVFSSIATNAYVNNLDTDNTWGYSYSMDNNISWTPYNGLPLYNNAQNKLIMNTKPAEDTVNFKIAAKASPTQPSGTYSNVINFSAVALVSPITLAEAYQSEGKELYHGYYTMQDMTHTICEKTEDVGAQLQVIDIRDDKIYWISKLADDNCWMTQNLDLDLTSDPAAENYVALTSENTDLNDATSAAYQDGYTTDESGIITWIPENSTIQFSGTDVDGWVSSNNIPYSASKTDSGATGHKSIGNYYNWSAVVASNESDSLTATSLSGKNIETNSVCPRGWRPPIVVNSSVNVSRNNFAKVNYYYNNNKTDTWLGLTNPPVYLTPTGRIRLIDGAGRLEYSGVYMTYWSSSNISTNNAAMLFGLPWKIELSANMTKSNGVVVRCLAR